MEEKKGLWAYCVIENKGIQSWETFGIHGTSPLYTVAHGEFAMVVSQEPMKKYPLVRDYLIAHQLANEKVMQAQPVLPVRFCTMAENEAQIIEQILKRKTRIEEFRKTVAEIRGKSEYGLRARWKDLDKVFADLGRESERVKTAKERALKLPERERHAGLIEVGHVVKEALEERNTNTAESFLKEMAPFAVQYKRNNVLGDMNILNAAFLVEQEKQVEFDEAVNALVGRYESEVQFKYVGPTPTFNFVEIVIKWDVEV